MPTPIKINSGNLKDLLTKGVNPKTIELLEGIRKTGAILKNKSDLLKIGITKDEIDKLTPIISFADPEPAQIIKTATIDTDLKGLTEYLLFVRNQNKNNFEINEDVYSIDTTDKTQIKYDDNIASDNFILSVKSPNGEFVQMDVAGKKVISVEIKKAVLNGAKLKIVPVSVISTNLAKPLSASKLKGRLLSNNPSGKLEKIQIVIEVAIVDPATDADYFPVCYAVSEQDGYFFTSQVQFSDFRNLKKARAKIGLLGIAPIDIRLDEKDLVTLAATNSAPATIIKIKMLPEKLILFINEAEPKELGKSNCDCDCQDLDFHDKKALDEFSFYTVVRTTEPLIEAFEISDVEEVNLEDIVDDDPDIRAIVSGIKTPKSILSSFISKHGNITKANVSSLIKESKAHALRIRIFKPPNRKKGRIDLDGTNGVDWDDKPTIYQATTIAHGHLLNFKQEWFNDGYTLGDLIYSLPLAPGQKKQIVVFDWDRKDSASNTQQLDYQESLYNSLSRDRDVNEVAKATLTEHTEGQSRSSTSSFAMGGGIGAIIPSPVPIGALIGAGGGSGKGSSSASQDSNRTTTAQSQQSINDKTVQSANAVRSQRSTVIQTVSQGERFQVSAEVIANYNHCHAMTIEYFEVLRHFEIRTRLADVQECLFIPLKVSPFDRKKALRWRDILFRCLRKPSLLPGFDALERIDEELESSRENYYDELGIPKDRYAEEEIEYIEGELYLEFQLKRPVNNDLDEFILDNWGFLSFFIGDPLEFYNRFIKREEKKDEAFAKYAGPKIAEAVFDEIRFSAVKNGQSISVRSLPIDATLLSDFKNRKRLNVSLRMSGAMTAGIKREDIDYIKISLDGATSRSEPLRRLENGDFLKIIVHSGSMRYKTKSLHEYLFKDSYIKNDLTLDGDDVRVFTPLSAKALRKPRLEDVEVSNSLLHHLNESIEYYHQCLWSNMNAQRRFMLLDGLIAPGKGNGRSVASVVENKLIGIVGNCLVMPVSPGFQLDPTLDDSIDLFEHYYENPKDPVHIALPTKGVFAEAVMGKCNSCEKKEESRFWRWEESPIPDSPTTINPFTLPTPQNTQPGNLQPKDFPASIINLQSGPSLPDPQGFGSLVSLLSNPNVFKDITGLTENQKNALAALQGAFGTAEFFGGKAADLTGQASALFSKNQAFAAKQNALDQIKKAKENGLITEEQAQNLTQDAFKSILGDSGSTLSQSVDDIAKTEKKIKDGEIKPEDGDAIKQMVIDKEKARTENESVTNKPAVTDAIQSFENVEEGSLQIEDGDRKINVTKGPAGRPGSSVPINILLDQEIIFTPPPPDGIQLFERIIEKGNDRLYEVYVSNPSIDDRFIVIDFELELDNTTDSSISIETLHQQQNVKPGQNKIIFATKTVRKGVTKAINIQPTNYKFQSFEGDPNAAIKPTSTLFLLPFPLSVGGSNEFTCGQAPNTNPGPGVTHTNSNLQAKFAVDFTMPMGTEIFASRDGVVISVFDTHPDLPVNASTGLTDPPPTDADLEKANFVHVRHSDGTIAEYLHLQQNGAKVTVGDPVTAGKTVIGFSGNSGFSTGPHLHIAILKVKHDLTGGTNSVFVSMPFKFKGSSGKGVTPRKGQKFKRT